MAPVDLQIGSSRTNINHTISTATVDDPDALLVQRGVEIYLTASDQPVVGDTMVRELVAQLSRRLPVQRITLIEDPGMPHSDAPLIYFEIADSELTWTPLWANASMTVDVVYASDGDISWRNAASMIMGQDTPTVHARGTIQLEDASRGVFSFFGYRRHLGKALGDDLFKMMESPLFDPPGS
ncbi:MAG: hypothetical protein R2856_28495 [Caldilineaceae bacterium]